MKKTKNESETATKTISFRQLAKQTGSDRASIGAWLEAAGVPVTDEGVDPANLDRALAAIGEHQRTSKRPPGAVDPKSGLTWWAAKLKEETKKLQRENELAEKTANHEWMDTAAHLQIVSTLCQKIEQAPGRIKSELGLTEKQREIIQKILDECRKDAADAIRVMKFSDTDTPEGEP